MYYSTIYSSPLGELLILSDGKSITRVCFSEKTPKSCNDDLAIFEKINKWFDDYFNGLNPKIDFKLNLQGSDFRLNVWKRLLEIPYGETLTYGEIACEISPSMSAQAVGGAARANPILIIIPCHRVIGKNGKLTGYVAGIDRKIRLLKIEKSKMA